MSSAPTASQTEGSWLRKTSAARPGRPPPTSSAVTQQYVLFDRTPVKGRGGPVILPGMRRLLILFSGLTLLAFVALFLGAGQTDRYFAWTINPPVTAAFLGA